MRLIIQTINNFVFNSTYFFVTEPMMVTRACVLLPRSSFTTYGSIELEHFSKLFITIYSSIHNMCIIIISIGGRM